MLPIYPFLAIVASYGFFKIEASILSKKIKTMFFALSLILISTWSLSFFQIYRQPNTRLAASKWISSNIPPGSVLAVEHWDDRLPVFNSNLYEFVELQLYNTPDDNRKWQKITQDLEKADYILLASNRLYVPLTKLKSCEKYERCYPLTAQYYEDLFSEKTDFIKIAEFTGYPTVPLLNVEIVDDKADESFTVYDHPKIMIFKRN